jgi:hypothetical protein
MITMATPINIRAGWIQVIVSPEKKFDNPETFEQITDPDELLSCWSTVKHIVDGIVEEQFDRSRLAVVERGKTGAIVDIYNALVKQEQVDDKVLLDEVLKTGKFSEDEAKSLIKKVKEEKLDGGMAWY